MKKAIKLSLLFCLTAVLPSLGQENIYDYLRFSNPEVAVSDNTVKLTFTVATDKKATSNGKTLVAVPHITDGESTVSFTPVVVQGKRSSVAWQRHEWSAGSDASYTAPVALRKGESVDYIAEVPLQWWMHGRTVQVETLIASCCSSGNDLKALENCVIPMPEPEAVIEVVEVIRELTVADSIAQVFPFVMPASEFDEENPINFYGDERDKAITIYFHINRYDIDQSYVDNRQTLANLMASIEIIRESVEANINKVVVAGFASPEGTFEFNDRLAFERAVSVKEYIIRNSGLRDEMISVYNGSADWQGLRQMVSDDQFMPGRQQILDMIDNTIVWNAESSALLNTRMRQLQGGTPFKYMADHIFPKLRNGTFIRVYYDNIED